MPTVVMVKYTDVDYLVFSDAARYITENRSPFERSTYRYTPLLALVLTPNIYLHQSFGKFIFCTADLISGILLFEILKINQQAINHKLLLVSTFLLNPVVINVSTRGNAESLVGLTVIASLYFLLKKRFVLGAICYGLSVHLKLYPVIYSLALMLYIDNERSFRSPTGAFSPRKLITKSRLVFVMISLLTFLSVTAYFWFLYGNEFLREAYFYHIWRKDVRHSFSLYFYYLYLSSTASPSSFFSGRMVALLTFLPQLVLLIFHVEVL